jgi:hypothetical protein
MAQVKTVNAGSDRKFSNALPIIRSLIPTLAPTRRTIDHGIDPYWTLMIPMMPPDKAAGRATKQIAKWNGKHEGESDAGYCAENVQVWCEA